MVDAIKAKQEEGCVLEVEGVGETTVHGGGGGGGGDCEDTGPDALCGMVGQGLLHCVDDFYPDCGESTSSPRPRRLDFQGC